MSRSFQHDYDLDSLVRVSARGFDFDLFVPPRFTGHYQQNTYERATALLIRQQVKGVGTFIDVGAHVGFYDVLVGRSNPDCSILALEPVPANCAILKKNLALNRVNAEVIQAAVSSRAGRADFQISEAADNSGFTANPAAGVLRTMRTKVVDLDQFLPRIGSGPVLIKVDTEGNEPEVLAGMHGILEQCDDLRLVIEFNPRCLENRGLQPGDFLAQLISLGLEVFFIDDGRMRYERYRLGMDWKGLTDGGRTRNLFCLRKERALNLCFFTHSANRAGAEQFLLELVSRLSAQYGTLSTVVLPGQGPMQAELEEHATATLIGDYPWWCAGISLPRPEVDNRMQAGYQHVLAACDDLARLAPDAILTNTLVIPWGAVAAMQLNLPHIWLVREFGYGFEFFYTHQKSIDIIRESSNRIVAISRAVRRTLFKDVDARRCIVGTYGSIPVRETTAPAPQYFLHPQALKLVISGTVIPFKGQDDAVHAVKRLIRQGQDVELCILGDIGSDFGSSLKAVVQAEGLSDRIHILEFVQDVYPLLNQADISLTCSRYEALSRAVIEPLLLGKPVIGTRVGGIPEMVEDGITGWLYTPGDVDQLVRKIEYFIKHPARIKEFGERARVRAAQKIRQNPTDELLFKICRQDRGAKPPFSRQLYDLTRTWERALLDSAGQARQEAAAHLAEQANALKAANGLVEERSASLASESTRCQETIAALEAATAGLAEQERELRVLAEQLAQKEQAEQRLGKQLAEKEKITENLSARIVEKEQIESRLREQQNLLVGQLNEVEDSLAYHLLSQYRLWIEKHLPNGSRRRRFYHFVVARVRIIFVLSAAIFSRTGREKIRYILKTRGLGSLIRSGFGKLTAHPETMPAAISPKVPGSITAHAETAPHLPVDQAEDIQSITTRLSIFLSSGTALALPTSASPLVSIIILFYNRAGLSLQCLESLAAGAGSVPFEVIILDNASTDETTMLLDQLLNVKIVRSPVNLGFGGGCNKAVEQASGKYLLFLNNDAIMLPNSLQVLLDTMEKDGQIGAAGGKLIFPDGRLQEAGSIIWQDGSCIGYGRGDDPFKPEYCHARDVDYCSAAFLLTRRDLFHTIGGFDKRFEPAYYEDTDYCLSLWQAGYRVVFQPFALAVHHEYGTAGRTDAITLQARNHVKFREKWDSVLRGHLPNSPKNLLLSRSRRRNAQRILYIDDGIPDYRLGSGLPRTFTILHTLADMGLDITFLPMMFPQNIPDIVRSFQEKGLEILYSNTGEKIAVRSFLQSRLDYYDYIFISRPHNMRKFMETMRGISLDAAIIYDAEAIFTLRDIAYKELNGIRCSRSETQKLIEEELSIISNAGLALTVSEKEKKVLEEHGAQNVFVLGHALEVQPTPAQFEDRKDILFVGGILNSPSPNQDAVQYFVEQIFPLVQKELNCSLYIVGTNRVKSIWELESESVHVIGTVDDLTPWYNRCRLFVVPTRYSAGISLKLLDAGANGLPAVVTPLILDQLGWTEDSDVLVGKDAGDFAKKVIALYSDPDLFNSLRKNALARISNEYSPVRLRESLQAVLDAASKRKQPPLRLKKDQDDGSLVDHAVQLDPSWKRHDTAVILHLFYPEMWEEIYAYLRTLKKFDLYVSIPHVVDFDHAKILNPFPHAYIHRCENRGRDIAPFIALLAAISPLHYKYVCKIHTKSSPNHPDGIGWRKDMLNKLLGSASTIEAVKRSFDKDASLGMLVPRGHLVDSSTYWEANAINVEKLARMTGLDFSGQEFRFAAGSMFWFRPEALRTLVNLPIRMDDFEEESGQTDGTLAHAIERLSGLLLPSLGYTLGEIMLDTPSTGFKSPAVIHKGDGRDKFTDLERVNRDPILVFQMGKVGSLTTCASLKKAYEILSLDVPVHHVHILTNFEAVSDRLKKERPNPGDTQHHLEFCMGLRKQMDEDPERVWKIVSLVREPVARNVGTFFHNLGEFIPDWKERYQAGGIRIQDLQELFLTIDSINKAPDRFFDDQMKPVFGIDVYASPFPHAIGYKTYWSKPRTPLLVIRLEDLDRVAAEAMHAFLALDGFEIVRSNIGENKDYADLYRQFKALPLPREYVEEMYATRYARHFYTPEERQRFFHQWTGG